MNPTDPQPDFTPELLAAYADGELPAAACEAVEDWLAQHPDAREALEAQEAFSPRNEEFRNAVAAPMPSPRAWDRVLSGIERNLPAPPRPERPPQRPWWLAGVLAATTAIAATVLVATLSVKQPPVPPVAPGLGEDVVLDDLGPVFRVAATDDVEIISAPEAARPMILVGAHPMGPAPVRLAGFEDVDIRAIAPGPGGEFPELHMTPHGVDSPMVWAPTPEPR